MDTKDQEIIQLRERVKEMEKELQNCNANHKDLVSRCALLRERPDLPVDRIPAYNELVRLQQLSQLGKTQGRVSVEKVKEFLPDALAEAQVETIPNSAIYDININILAQAIVKLVEGER